ncbi:hypothetical protein MPLA_770065 [Mesorhizobium sp. ORS 3359]|nr:hypothetical protein MPLA_770065 [Mesorhizobium sp. ORS 3359]
MEVGEYVSLGAKFFARRWSCNFLYVNSDIDEDAIRYVVQETERMRRRAFLFLFLQTENGNAASAQSIVGYLNEKYHWVSVVALEQCRGDGAAMCTGFDEVWVSEPNALQAAYQSQVPFHPLDRSKVWSEFKMHDEMLDEDDDGRFERDLQEFTEDVRRMISKEPVGERGRQIRYLNKLDEPQPAR